MLPAIYVAMEFGDKEVVYYREWRVRHKCKQITYKYKEQLETNRNKKGNDH